jgi:integrase
VARSIRSTHLETRTARLKLAPRKKPYAVRVAPGVRLGYRRNEGAGTWSVIAADGKSGNWIKKFALADDHEEADGEYVLTYWQAQDRSRRLARSGGDAEQHDAGRPVTVREALEAYETDLRTRGADLHNVARVRGHLSEALTAKAVALLSARELRRFRDGLIKRKLKPASVNRIGNALRAALNLAASHDPRINSQSAWRIGLAGLHDAEQSRNVILPDQTIRDIIVAAYGHCAELGLLVETAAITGARVSQLARLTVADLQGDRADSRLLMPSSRKGRGAKRVRHQPVPISTSLAAKLRHASTGRPEDALLLTKPDGSPWKQSDHTRPFQRAVVDAQLDPSKVTIAALRHCSIVRALLANVPIRVVATTHDTSVPMIERTYSKFISDHSDALTRRALLDADQPTSDNVVPLAGR